jgi:hypothetical protein
VSLTRGEIKGTVEWRLFARSDEPQANVSAASTFDLVEGAEGSVICIGRFEAFTFTNKERGDA